MSKLTDYIVVEESSKFILEDTVNEYLAKGFECVGGVSVCSVPRPGMVRIVYVQAMAIRYGTLPD
jgi:hypothetical protein